MSRPRRINVFWGIALALTFALWWISLRWNVTYAGDFGFYSLTDGYLIWAFPGQRCWGDWGWWVQSPWNEPLVSWDEFILPILVGGVPQVRATGLFMPLATIYGALIYVPIRRVTNWLDRRFGASTLFLVLVVLAFGVILSVLPIMQTRLLLASWIVVFFHVSRTMGYALRRLPRVRPGYCSSCGYNLTGNQSGICPECGTTIEEGQASTAPTSDASPET